jgi:threonine dehydrogenase-like Zn-dependent dehydrogenase
LCTSIQSFFYKTSFGFAEEMISPAISAIPYDGLSPEEACMAEPLGVALDMLRLADIEIGSHVVVSGLGPIGLMALRLAKLSGAARVYGCELSSSAARIAKACEFGADEIILVDQQPLATYPFVQPPDRFLISSPPRSLVPFFDVAAKGAIFSFIGIEYGEGATVCFDLNEFHFKKLQLRASFASPALYTPAALELITRLREDFRSLITHTFPLSEIQAALKAAHQCERAIKVIVKP